MLIIQRGTTNPQLEEVLKKSSKVHILALNTFSNKENKKRLNPSPKEGQCSFEINPKNKSKENWII